MATSIASIKIKGMTCSSCASTIERRLKSLPCVTEVNINLLLDEAVIYFEGMEMQASDLAEEITAIGFEAKVLSVLSKEPRVSESLVLTTTLRDDQTHGQHLWDQVRHELLSTEGVDEVTTDAIGASMTVRHKQSLLSLEKLMSIVTMHSPTIEVAHSSIMTSQSNDIAIGSGSTTALLRLHIDLTSDLVRDDELRKNLVRLSDTQKAIHQVRITAGSPNDFFVEVLYSFNMMGARDVLHAILSQVQAVDTGASVKPTEVLSGIDDENKADTEALVRNAIWCIAIAVIIMWLSMAPPSSLPSFVMKQALPGVSVRTLLIFALATPVQWLGGQAIHKQAWSGLSRGQLTMNSFVSFNTSFCYIISVVLIVGTLITHLPFSDPPLVLREMKQKPSGFLDIGFHSVTRPHRGILPFVQIANDVMHPRLLQPMHPFDDPPTYFDTAAILIAVILAGKLLEHMAKARTLTALRGLNRGRCQNATIIRNIWPSVKSPPKFSLTGDHIYQTHRACVSGSGIINKIGSVTKYTKTLRFRPPVILPFSDFTWTPLTEESSLIYDMDLVSCSAALIQAGDVVLVDPGQQIAADGILITGPTGTSIDESLLTGECVPVVKYTGDLVYEGSVVYGQSVWVVVTSVGYGTLLGQIMNTVRTAPTVKTKSAVLADKICGYFLPVTLFIACITWLAWTFLVLFGFVNPFEDDTYQSMSFVSVVTAIMFVLKFGIAVLAIACPCALGLATPTATTVASGMAVRLGVLVKDGASLEAASTASCIILDKTGTITQGKPNVKDIYIDPVNLSRLMTLPQSSGSEVTPKQRSDPPIDFDHCHLAPCRGISSDTVQPLYSAFWSLLVYLEFGSKHPIAEALIAHAREEPHASLLAKYPLEPSTLSVTSVYPVGGRGVKGRVLINDTAETDLYLGSLPLYHSICHEKDQGLGDWIARDPSHTLVVLFTGIGSVLGAVKLNDTIVPEARQTVAYLRDVFHLQVHMCTGDNEAAAIAIARQVGIDSDKVLSSASPWVKRDLVTRLSASVGGTIMVGDGHNDSLALSQADVGIAVGLHAEILAAAADVVLIKHDLTALLSFLNLSGRTRSTIQRNFAWAFLFNILGMPAAAGVFWPHISVTPLMAGSAMACSSLLVVLNSLLLYQLKPVGGSRFHEFAPSKRSVFERVSWMYKSLRRGVNRATFPLETGLP